MTDKIRITKDGVFIPNHHLVDLDLNKLAKYVLGDHVHVFSVEIGMDKNPKRRTRNLYEFDPEHFDVNEWCDWARKNNISPVVTEYWSSKFDDLRDSEIGTGTPRQWEYISNFFDSLGNGEINSKEFVMLAKGVLGDDLFDHFIRYHTENF